MLKLYYETLVSTIVESLRIETFNVTYDEFLKDIKSSIPLSLFFCGNIHDLDLTEGSFELQHQNRLERMNSVTSEDFANGESQGGPTGILYRSILISFATTIMNSFHVSEGDDTFRRLQSCISFLDVETPRIEFTSIRSSNETENRNHPDPPPPSLSDRVSFTLSNSPSTASCNKSTAASEASSTTAAAPDSPEPPSPDKSGVMLERRALSKVPTIANDHDLVFLEDKRTKKKLSTHLSPRKARAMRRKLYLDLYRDAVNRKLI